MSIDWITVSAQIANFLVLVWLLKRFLYRPILDGIDAREAEITARMQEASRTKDHAKTMEQAYQEKVAALNIAESEMTETIRKRAEEQRDALLAEAQKRLEQEHATWKAHLDDEARKYITKMQKAGADALLSLTRKALLDLADETLEARVARHLLNQIKPMVRDIRRAAGQASEAIFTSQYPLPTPVQEDLSREIQDHFPDIAVRFETDEMQAPGLVLRIGGAHLAWTVDTYLDELESHITAQLAFADTRKVTLHGQ